MTETEKKKIQEKIRDYLQKFKFDSEIKDKKWWICAYKISKLAGLIIGLVAGFYSVIKGESKIPSILSLVSFSIAAFSELANDLKLKPEKEELKDKREEMTKEKTISIILEEE